ncbi:MAG: A/G-specific adenine glycosylase, partial [Candidatus Limnocylindrales bacterium]
LRLPGVGPYTARAVAALAFGQPVGAVDTNVRRVLDRAVGGRPSAFSARELQAVADASVSRDRPGHWTHALMDLGATICRPRAPRCDRCPARPWCRAVANGSAELRADAPSLPAGADRGARLARERPAPFATTSRWLRGRILERLRDAAPGAWAIIDAPYGSHDAAGVEAALAAMAREGLLERHAGDASLARLPIT